VDTARRFFFHMLEKYFPDLTRLQLDQFARLEHLLRQWNGKVNLVSRKDIDNLEIHHILHALSIAKVFSFVPGTRIMDAGTGGGLPGIPLSILFPDVIFTLVDSIEKKIRAVEDICTELGLRNTIPLRMRFEEVPGTFDYITGRAVTRLPEIYGALRKKIAGRSANNFPNGLIYLKGGDFEEELLALKTGYHLYALSDFFNESYFQTKKLVHVYELPRS
jgi:16S rRNA (guanine527-N7)-methyltransferase